MNYLLADFNENEDFELPVDEIAANNEADIDEDDEQVSNTVRSESEWFTVEKQKYKMGTKTI